MRDSAAPDPHYSHGVTANLAGVEAKDAKVAKVANAFPIPLGNLGPCSHFCRGRPGLSKSIQRPTRRAERPAGIVPAGRVLFHRPYAPRFFGRHLPTTGTGSTGRSMSRVNCFGNVSSSQTYRYCSLL